MTARLRVDPVACDGYGYCAELLPELIGLDEWGYPMLSADAVPPRLLDLARRAVADCPRRALTLVEAEAPAGPDRPATARPATVGPARVRLASSRRR